MDTGGVEQCGERPFATLLTLGVLGCDVVVAGKPEIRQQRRKPREFATTTSQTGGGGSPPGVEIQDPRVHHRALLQGRGAPLQTLETEEPNLERVFLHLTGRGLRD